MLSVLIIFGIAGTCSAQSLGLFSDCARQQNIIGQCSDAHLFYLHKVSAAQVKDLQRVSEIDDPSFLLEKFHLDSICNETMHLQQYYLCVYANLTGCLQQANSTRAKDPPVPATISRGIGHLCDSRDDLNKTCLELKATDVKTCFATFTGESDMSGDQCAAYEALVRCTEKVRVCIGGDVVKDFVVSARPNGCQATGAAMPVLMTSVQSGLLMSALLLGCLVFVLRL
ncbi:uncharacterized protein LOC143293789 [Babylonia areolata]|uniref:uncharacterized protein LOC143293789 n=1 Tax=Babylonia areolata TaxID=304850 RepID=UPI003FCF4B5A